MLEIFNSVCIQAFNITFYQFIVIGVVVLIFSAVSLFIAKMLFNRF